MMLRVLSLGAGVQSTTLALMAAHGEIEPPDCAIFADTGWEPRAVYEHLRWLMSPNVLPFPVHIVSDGNIRDNLIAGTNNRGKPFSTVPFFLAKPNGDRGIGQRQCTKDYKLYPIVAEIRRLLGKPHPARIAPGAVTQLVGISLDEAHRMKPAKQKFIQVVWPLIDLGMSRRDCLKWIERHGYPEPPKSACIGCPYTDNERWRDRHDNHPEEWADAVAVDAALRQDKRGDRRVGQEFMHASLVPLDQVDFSTQAERSGQLDFFGGECDGICGL